MVLGYLDELNVEYEKAPRLVRGLDYYVRTTFECVHEGLGAQSAIGGGGRYDGLIETLGGPAIGGIGFGLGVDRTCLAVQAESLEVGNSSNTLVYVIPVEAEAVATAIKLTGQIRSVGMGTEIAFDNRSVKAAMKGADRSGAQFAVLIGPDELSSNSAVLKNLQSGTQEVVALDLVINQLKKSLN